MRWMNIIAVVTLCGPTTTSAKDGHGLNLESPGLIDAVASVLYPLADQERFTRVDDDTVLLEVMNGFILQLRKMPGRECSFQVQKLNESTPAINQYNFGQLTGDYRTVPDRYGPSANILFDGEAAWCEKDKNGLRCWNSMHVAVYGLNDSRKVMRAMSFIQRNYCPPAKPKQPF